MMPQGRFANRVPPDSLSQTPPVCFLFGTRENLKNGQLDQLQVAEGGHRAPVVRQLTPARGHPGGFCKRMRLELECGTATSGLGLAGGMTTEGWEGKDRRRERSPHLSSLILTASLLLNWVQG